MPVVQLLVEMSGCDEEMKEREAEGNGEIVEYLIIWSLIFKYLLIVFYFSFDYSYLFRYAHIIRMICIYPSGRKRELKVWTEKKDMSGRGGLILRFLFASLPAIW